MPFQIIRQDITLMSCDAIVNPTDQWFSGSGGTDQAIHAAAGPELDAACKSLGALRIGDVAVTDAYSLPCRYVFHTVGPIWKGGTQNEAALLRSCYLNALLKARELDLSSIAFPLISSGTFGFPKDRVLRIATDAVSDFLTAADSEFQVYICILDRHSYALSREIALHEYLDIDRSAPVGFASNKLRPGKAARRKAGLSAEVAAAELSCESALPADCDVLFSAAMPVENAPQMPDLAEWIKKQDDSFAVMLLKLIDRTGMTDVQCYKKANVSKSTFWKINNEPNYKPSKTTVIAFAIALELTLDETEQLLKAAGFTLSNSNTFDRIIQFYIMTGNYDIFEINAALFRYDQVCLGC